MLPARPQFKAAGTGHARHALPAWWWVKRKHPARRIRLAGDAHTKDWPPSPGAQTEALGFVVFVGFNGFIGFAGCIGSIATAAGADGQCAASIGPVDRRAAGGPGVVARCVAA